MQRTEEDIQCQPLASTCIHTRVHAHTIHIHIRTHYTHIYNNFFLRIPGTTEQLYKDPLPSLASGTPRNSIQFTKEI